MDGCIRDDYGTTHGYYPNFSAINHDLASQFKLYTGEEKMKNFKVICIKGYIHLFTRGKIYDVVEGEITNDYGGKIGNFTSVDEINKRLIPQFKLINYIYEYTNDSIMAFKNALNTTYGLPRFVNTPAIQKVIFNNPATIVIWSDGTKTVVKAEHEEFDPEKGLAMAISKKALGNKGNYYEEFKKWLPEEYKEESGATVRNLVDQFHELGMALSMDIRDKNEPEHKE